MYCSQYGYYAYYGYARILASLLRLVYYYTTRYELVLYYYGY